MAVILPVITASIKPGAIQIHPPGGSSRRTGPAFHGRGGARGLRLRGGRHSLPLLELSPAGVGGITANCGRGEHKATGMSVQILVLPGGRLVWASDPYPGSMHDVAALDASGLLNGLDLSGWIADKGYIGRRMITPHKKPPQRRAKRGGEGGQPEHQPDPPGRRADHRPHQVLENPPHRLPPPSTHIRADHHRRTLTPRRLFWVCPGSFPGGDMIMAHPRGVSWAWKIYPHDLGRSGPS